MRREIIFLGIVVALCVFFLPALRSNAATVRLTLDGTGIPYGTKIYYIDEEGNRYGPLQEIVWVSSTDGQRYTVYRYGNDVTYHTPARTWTEFVPCGESCLSPSERAGNYGKYTFIGWGTSETAVASGIIMEGSAMHLYGVYRHSHSGSSSTGGGCYTDGPYTGMTSGSRCEHPNIAHGNYDDSFWDPSQWGRDYWCCTYCGSASTSGMDNDHTDPRTREPYTYYKCSCGLEEGQYLHY